MRVILATSTQFRAALRNHSPPGDRLVERLRAEAVPEVYGDPIGGLPTPCQLAELLLLLPLRENEIPEDLAQAAREVVHWSWAVPCSGTLHATRDGRAALGTFLRRFGPHFRPRPREKNPPPERDPRPVETPHRK